MEKTSIIKSVQFKNEWTKDGNTIYFHNIELENGDKGSIGTKEKLPAKLSIGTELTYTIDGERIKAIAKAPAFKGGGGFKTEPYEHKMAGMAFSFAKDLVVAGKVEVSKIEAVAEKIYQWLMSKKV